MIKLITLNVEGNKHWDRIVPFLERETPDVLCMQELFDCDAAMLAKRFGYHFVQIPITKKLYDPRDPSSVAAEGPTILSHLLSRNSGSTYYYKAAQELQVYRATKPSDLRETMHRGIVWSTAEKDGEYFSIACTQFTWTPDGKPDENQNRDVKELFKVLHGLPELVLCGDFNVPRKPDNHIYQALAKRFTDNIPTDLQATLDLAMHRDANRDPFVRAWLATLVVDYIFSTPAYTVKNVRCEFGLSDHCAVIADIERQP